MALLKLIIFPKYALPIAVNSCRHIRTTAICCDVKWREKQGLCKNPNAYGPLTDYPDYTFMSGDRRTPLGSNQKKRMMVQRREAAKMVTLINEMEDAIPIFQNAKDAKQKHRENIIANKFKPKGVSLLKKK